MNQEIHLKILRVLEKTPEITQRELAQHLGVSLGKINYCLKALKEKGLVKWSHFSSNPNKKQYLHLLTTKGIFAKIELTSHFLMRKQAEYDDLRREIKALTAELDQDRNEGKVQ